MNIIKNGFRLRRNDDLCLDYDTTSEAGERVGRRGEDKPTWVTVQSLEMEVK